MKVSIFKHIKIVTPYKDLDVFEVLDYIKTGKWKKQVSELRTETDKTKRNELKSKLPYITVCGTFSNRSNTGLKRHSGLACLDFDDVDDLEFIRESINKDVYTFTSFVSPSGNGLKVFVKIPLIDNDLDYKDYYLELQKHYNKYTKTDISTSDLSRATFISYDPYIYINIESELFTDKFNRVIELPKQAEIPLTDQNEIAERLMVWFKKRYVGYNRNTNLHSLARQFNSFGIDKNTCFNYLLPYQQIGFGEKEITLLINSAYKYTIEFNTSSFEDNKKIKQVEKFVRQGQTKEYISKVTGVDEKAIDNKIKSIEIFDFWTYDKNGNPVIDFFRYKEFLKSKNIFKVFTNDDDDGYAFIKKDGNFIDYIERTKIKDFTLNYLEDNNYIDVFNVMALRPMFFSKEGLSIVNTADFEIEQDTEDMGIIYYQNKAVKVSVDEFELIDYDDLEGYVWENRVVKRDIEISPKSDGEFKTFIWKISGEDKERYYTIKSVLGYLMHSYKDRSKTRAIILNDEMISDVPNGGSGKGLLNMAISHIKKLGEVNGKSYKHDNQFRFQKVPFDSQVVHFDDVNKNFDFENLFSLITGDFEIEKKGKDPFVMKFENSPKITISTNYTIKGNGGSFNRRVFELELSAYFNDKHSPRDEFGHDLFTNWDDKEWAKFDNFMLRCLQYFLNNGLVPYQTINLELKKLMNETNKDFVDFMDSQLFNGQRFYKTELKDEFIDEYEDYKDARWFTSNLFNKWVIKYCSHNLIKYESGKSNGQRWISIGDETNKEVFDEIEEIPF